MASEKQMHLAGTAGDVAGGQLPAGIAGEKKKNNQGGWFYFTLSKTHFPSVLHPSLIGPWLVVLIGLASFCWYGLRGSFPV